MEVDQFRREAVRLRRSVQRDTGGLGHIDVDVYTPPESLEKPAGGWPVVFFVVGGAWMLADHRKAVNPCKTLASRGYMCVSSSYRQTALDKDQTSAVFFVTTVSLLALSAAMPTPQMMLACMVLSVFVLTITVIIWTLWPSTDPQYSEAHPAQIQDVARGFAWTYHNIASYGGNPDKIITMGHSAGAHLAALMSTNHSYLRRYAIPEDTIKGCVGLSGVYSEHRLAQSMGGQQLLKAAFGLRHNYSDAFPIHNVDAETTPPFLLVNAGRDLGLKRHTMDFHYTLLQEGVYSRAEYFNELTHWNITEDIERVWPDGDEGHTKTIFGVMDDFMKEALEYAGESS
jgi:acetyl esterase/lipase